MKRMSILWCLFFLLAFQPGFAQTQEVQKNKKSNEAAVRQEEVKDIIESGKFIFQAQRMIPMRGGFWPLTGVYDLRVSQEEVRSFLPYFGRLYMMPITPADGPLRFESKDFGYTVKERNKGGWEVLIRPKDVSSVQEMLLTIYDNGQANLRVTSNNRQPISFDGYITA